MKKAIFCVLVCMLMILSAIIPVSGTILSDQTSKPSTKGNILYVGGSGPNNYTRIQDAVDNASDGDTVFVYDDSSPYYEQITIESSITLRGEDKNTTIIDGEDRQHYVILVKGDDVTISGFTIQKSGWIPRWNEVEGIFIDGNNSIIKGNIIQKCSEGIHLISKEAHYLLNNVIQNNRLVGIAVYNGANVTISGNFIAENGYIGIWVWGVHNKIFENIVTANHYDGINIIGTLNNVTENTVQNHRVGRLRGTGIDVLGTNNSITRNNLLNNSDQAFQEEYGTLTEIQSMRKQNNVWDGNYWGKPLTEKRIFGRLHIQDWPLRRFWVPWITYDYHPAQQPFDIPGME